MDSLVSGPYGSITAIRHYYILFNVMINYITGMIYIASDAGVGKLSMSDVFEDPEQVLLKRTKDLIKNLSPISFGKVTKKEKEKFVTFCQGKKYEDNLKRERGHPILILSRGKTKKFHLL